MVGSQQDSSAVRQDIQAALNLLLMHPDVGARVTEASLPDVRRLHLDRIRYWVYYRVQRNRLEVLSVWHSSRGSGLPVIGRCQSKARRLR